MKDYEKYLEIPRKVACSPIYFTEDLKSLKTVNITLKRVYYDEIFHYTNGNFNQNP